MTSSDEELSEWKGTDEPFTRWTRGTQKGNVSRGRFNWLVYVYDPNNRQLQHTPNHVRSVWRGPWVKLLVCPDCDGRGVGGANTQPIGTCRTCGGSGRVPERETPAVVVDPSDPATIERAARGAHHYDIEAVAGQPLDIDSTEGADDCWEDDSDQDYYRGVAAAVLASLTDTGDNKETQQ